MKRKPIAGLLILLIVAMLASSFAGCGGTSNNDGQSSGTTTGTIASQTSGGTETTAAPADEPGWKKDTSPITFDWYVNFSWQLPGDVWSNTLVGKYVAEKTGIKLNIIAPAGNENEKFNTLIASNSLPDLITADCADPLMKKIMDSGLVYSLNELADQYDPYFYKVIDNGVFSWNKMADGKTYGYPNWAYGPDSVKKYQGQIEGTTTFEVRKDIYEAIGKPDMRTPEGFLNALKAAKEKYPKVNGQPLIPLGFHEFIENGCVSLWYGANLESLLPSYLNVSRDKDGKYNDRLTDPEMQKWLKTIRKANEMGLISKEVFVDKDTQIREKVSQGRYFAMMYRRSDMLDENTTLAKKYPGSEYIAIDPPANTNMDKSEVKMVGGPVGWCLNSISKKCKNPERAIKFFTYLISEEGQRDVYLGKQGETWDVIDGKEQFKPDMYTLLTTDKKKFDNTIGGQYGAFQLLNILIVKKWEPALAEPNKQLFDWTLDKAVCIPQFDDMYTLPSTDEGIIDKKICDKWGIALPKLILAKSDAEFDNIFNQFLSDRQAAGYDKLNAYWQKRYQENKVKLGIN
jgi:ABC-type sugar transport system, periplasmic component